MQKDPVSRKQLFGLMPHEIPFVGLLLAAFYFSGVEFRGSPWPVPLFGAAIIASIGILAGRCREEWNPLPNKFFFFGLASVWVALFNFLGNSTLGYVHSPSIFPWLFDIYTSPQTDSQYGLLIPFVVLALYWWKRKTLVAQPPGLWLPALGFIVAGLLLHLCGFVAQQPRISILGFLVGLYGLTGLAWGKFWLKSSLFPFFLFLFSIPPVDAIDAFTFRLRLLVSWLVAGIAHFGLAPDLIREGTQLFDAQHTFGYDVAPACSGIHSLIALLVITIIYGFVSFNSTRNRIIIIVSAIPLAVIGNVVRLSFTIFIAELGGQDAGKFVETKFGFITFAVALGCIILIGRWLEKREPKLETKTEAAQ